MSRRAFLAADFGGGSGRVIAGEVNGGKVTLDEVHRFPNNLVEMGGHVFWDFPALFRELITGIKKGVEKGYEIAGIGVDTWGVDFGFIDRNGNMVMNPVSYRCPSTSGCAERFFTEDYDRATHYSRAGVQIMDINSIYRLKEMKEWAPEILKAADKLLFMPDLFSYFLTGEANVEKTIASTSELLDPYSKEWNRELIKQAGLPERLFGELVAPGTVRGYLTAEVMKQTGIDYQVPVIAVGSHDTASAVFASGADFAGEGAAFLSSGTWSLLGVVMPEPIITEEARESGFTNETGVDGFTTFLQNITGLWIVQCLVREWERKGEPVEIGALVAEAEASDYSGTVDVDDAVFHNPKSMEGAIKEFVSAHGFDEPKSRGDVMRCVMLSLAERYARGIKHLNRMLPNEVKSLHIIGGGVRNKFLNRLTAEATGVKVVAGPAEATAIGNILLQARTAGVIKEVNDIKEIVNYE